MPPQQRGEHNYSIFIKISQVDTQWNQQKWGGDFLL